ncbi:MAG: DUF6468 domain-containing protein [Alphaproteobacteria bacterium]|nr:DUF6468 domain-containing protein [Alphaproteobacteria bacterium]MDX5417147.1 DUF6468 domain-containing protein [Alphaproteobacteria bacterium]MDX5494577.1 DUF6468 domain-containing protein [Alphaproteobacteria bacterium]
MFGELPFSTVLEIIVCLFLAATIAYCAVLDRKLRAMRAGQDGMRELVSELNNATQRAVGAIDGLKRASEESGEELAERIRRARGLADELSLMLESGNSIAERLGRSERSPQAAPAATRPATRPITQRDAATAARAANQLLDALKKKSG